jgi:hypothetical protein
LEHKEYVSRFTNSVYYVLVFRCNTDSHSITTRKTQFPNKNC